jgi:hypothetical protein
MILAHENRCAMCGKDAIVRDKPDSKNEKEQKQELVIFGIFSNIIEVGITISNYSIRAN